MRDSKNGQKDLFKNVFKLVLQKEQSESFSVYLKSTNYLNYLNGEEATTVLSLHSSIN